MYHYIQRINMKKLLSILFLLATNVFGQISTQIENNVMIGLNSPTNIKSNYYNENSSNQMTKLLNQNAKIHHKTLQKINKQLTNNGTINNGTIVNTFVKF